MTVQMWFASIVGVFFLGAMFIIFARNAFNPQPLNPGVARFLRIMIALFGAAFATILTGFLTVDVTTGAMALKAGAGLGVFIVLYLVDPPQEKKSREEKKSRALVSVLRIEFAPNWTLRQSISKTAELANGHAELVGFTDAQLDTPLGVVVTVQGANGLAALEQLNKNAAVKTKFSVAYEESTATYKVRLM